MPHCINKSNPLYKSLLEQSNLKEPILDSYIMVWQDKNNSDSFPTLGELNSSIKKDNFFEYRNRARDEEEYSKVQHILENPAIAAIPKIINALQTPKIEQFYTKQFKSNPEKFYSEVTTLAGKQQTQWLRDFIEREHPSSYNDLVTGLAAEMSYTVRIDTAKEQQGKERWQITHDPEYGGAENPFVVIDNIEGLHENFKTEQEAENFVKSKGNNTKYYSNLTVNEDFYKNNPDWEYKEQRITTPLITPSIKGHAQFAESNDIGWFRAWYNKKTGEVHVIEVQSDLFQKGRVKSMLVKVSKSTEIPIDKFTYNDEFSDFKTTFVKKDGKWYDEDYQKYPLTEQVVVDGYNNFTSKSRDVLNQPSSNQFLQLLNKDNNWVTFFVKSIIQDSAKKGYEKVLFPTGNTASKVEGHSTLEEFKKQKEDRLNDLVNQTKEIKLQLNSTVKTINDIKVNEYLDHTREIPVRIVKIDGKWFKEVENDEPEPGNEEPYNYYPVSDEQMVRYFSTDRERGLADSIRTNENEINQLKQELERIEKEGFGALKPIYNFYENTVANILRKQYGKENVENITDEFGNTWLGVSANKGLETIYFSKQEIKSTKASEEVLKLVKDFMEKAGISQTKIENYAISHNVLGIADPIKNLVAVVEGMENIALPEESFHIAVAIIKEAKPELYNKLMNEITSYKLYGEVLKKYKDVYTKNGKPDIEKIKEEAIAKVLVEHLINNVDNSLESKQKLEQIKSIWQTIKDFLFSLFRKTGFQQALETILDNELDAKQITKDSGHFYSISQQDIANKVEEIHQQSSQKESESLKDRDGKPKTVYVINGNEMSKRVSDSASESYNRLHRNGDLTKSEYQKMVDDIKAENGTGGHVDAQHIVEYLTDENGRFVSKPIDTGYIPKTSREIYTKLFNFLHNKLQQYPESIIKAERRVINEKESIGGTVDVLIFQPDGTVQILDWKFNELDPSKSKDIPWYKKNSWDIQLRGYKKILSEAYGIPYSKIKAEIIPIRTIYKYSKNGKAPTLYDVEIGSSDVSKITKDYLLPYQESRQSTGQEDFDKLISRLNSLTEDISKIDVKGNPERKYVKAEQLNAIQKSIRHIQAKQSLTPFVEQANLYMKDVANLIDRYNELKDIDLKDKGQFTILNNFGHEVEYALSQLPKYQKIAVLFNDIEDTSLLAELKQISANADILDSKLRDKVLKPIVEKIAASQNIAGINSTEAQINMINRNFVETSNLDVASIQLMHRLVKQAHNERDFKLDEKLKEFVELSKQFKKEDNSLVFRKDNTLIRQYSKEFYQELKDKVLNKDKEWLKENVDMEKYLEKIENVLNEQISYIEARPYSEEQKNEEISKLKDKFNPKNNGLWHTNYLKQFPLSKWESEEWKKMRANESASKMYDFMVSFNKYASNIGYLDKESGYKHFLPFVRKGFAEALYSGGKLQFWDRFLSAITVDSDDYLFGQKDENGQPVYKLMRPFTNKLREGKEVSEDYLSNFGNYIKAVYNYATLSEIEGFVSLIKQNEQAKKSLAINNIGNTIIDVDTGRLKELETNLVNTEVFVKHQANLIYGQKYADGSDTDTSLGKVGELANKINKATEKYFNTTLISKNMVDSSFSMNKTINMMNKVFQIKVLGFAPFPALSNLIGGTLQNMVSSGIFFTKSDIFTGSLAGIQAMGPEKGKKFIAAMNYFMPFIHNPSNEKALRQLSDLKLTPHDIQNFIMFGMKGSDLVVQFQIFAGLWKNMIVKDGQIMNARLLKHLGEDVNVEELIEKYGIEKHSRVEDGKLIIDGVDRNSKTVYEQRDLSQSLAKRATGSLTSSEVRGINLNVYTDSAMMFKNWIPALVSQRFKKLSKPADLPVWEWGRVATVASVVGFNFAEASTYFIDSLAMLTGFNPQLSKSGKIIKDPTKATQMILELYEKERDNWVKQTGKSPEEFTQTKEEFTNLLRQNLLSAARELGYLTIMMSAFFMLRALPPDEDELTRNKMKSLQRLADKISDELAFYYNPASLISITNGNLIPSIGLLTDASKVFSHSFKEIWGLTYGENGMLGVDVDENQVIKYWLKSFPITSQLSSFMPIVMPDLAKDLGIKATTQARR